MINKNLNLSLLSILFFLPTLSQAKTSNEYKHPLYVGALGGFGSTTWKGLVPSKINQNLALSMSTPIKAQEGGEVWGFLAGYELTPFFALEANYMHFPGADVFFDEQSLFSFNYDGLTRFHTKTETLSLMGKVMLILPDTKIRLFSSAGLANIHRQDMIVDDWNVGPSFGVGLNYPITDHLMGEIGGNYITGYGESQLNPADAYFPFLYAVSIRLAYHF